MKMQIVKNVQGNKLDEKRKLPRNNSKQNPKVFDLLALKRCFTQLEIWLQKSCFHCWLDTESHCYSQHRVHCHPIHYIKAKNHISDWVLIQLHKRQGLCTY